MKVSTGFLKDVFESAVPEQLVQENNLALLHAKPQAEVLSLTRASV